jgi:hypothetical protein
LARYLWAGHDPGHRPGSDEQYEPVYLDWDRDFGLPSLSVIGPDLCVLVVDDYYADRDIADYL